MKMTQEMIRQLNLFQQRFFYANPNPDERTLVSQAVGILKTANRHGLVEKTLSGSVQTCGDKIHRGSKSGNANAVESPRIFFNSLFSSLTIKGVDDITSKHNVFLESGAKAIFAERDGRTGVYIHNETEKGRRLQIKNTGEDLIRANAQLYLNTRKRLLSK